MLLHSYCGDSDACKYLSADDKGSLRIHISVVYTMHGQTLVRSMTKVFTCEVLGAACLELPLHEVMWKWRC